jgi:hypothetical protein
VKALAKAAAPTNRRREIRFFGMSGLLFGVSRAMGSGLHCAGFNR